jgi:hypothetical protein
LDLWGKILESRLKEHGIRLEVKQMHTAHSQEMDQEAPSSFIITIIEEVISNNSERCGNRTSGGDIWLNTTGYLIGDECPDCK